MNIDPELENMDYVTDVICSELHKHASVVFLPSIYHVPFEYTKYLTQSLKKFQIEFLAIKTSIQTFQFKVE